MASQLTVPVTDHRIRKIMICHSLRPERGVWKVHSCSLPTFQALAQPPDITSDGLTCIMDTDPGTIDPV